jgi:hypothetical protein
MPHQDLPMLDGTSWRWAVLGCALMCVPAMAVWDGWIYWQLRSKDIEAAAIVTGKTEHGSYRSRRYVVEYAFRDGSGRKHWSSQRVPHTLYARVRIGEQIYITYSEADPETSAALLDVLHDSVALFSLISLMIALGSASATWWWHYARRKTLEHDAASSGIPV